MLMTGYSHHRTTKASRESVNPNSFLQALVIAREEGYLTKDEHLAILNGMYVSFQTMALYNECSDKRTEENKLEPNRGEISKRC